MRWAVLAALAVAQVAAPARARVVDRAVLVVDRARVADPARVVDRVVVVVDQWD